MKSDRCNEKLQLKYPCEWTYKVIGTHTETLQNVVREIMQLRQFSITLSNKSKTKKYYAMNLITQVTSEADRNALYLQLKNHKEIVMVL